MYYLVLQSNITYFKNWPTFWKHLAETVPCNLIKMRLCHMSNVKKYFA